MVDEGKGRPNTYRDKNVGKHRRRKVGNIRIQENKKSLSLCLPYPLRCDLGWF